MMNKKQNNVKKAANTLNSKWLQNTLRSLGVAGMDMVQELIPATSETISSGSKAVTDAVKSVRSTKTSGTKLINAIKSNPAVKMGEEFFKNAIDDIKTGNIYNTERSSMDDSFMSDMDTAFEDIDEMYGPDENPDVNIVNQNSNNDATIKALQMNAEYQVKSSKATVDTMVSIASTSMIGINEIGSRVLSELSAINTNLSSLVEYSNTNIQKFIDASIGYYEQMSINKSNDSGYDSSRISADNIYGTKGGLNFQSYKEYIKQNIADIKDSSMIGSAANMILEHKDMITSNPIGLILKSVMKSAIPNITKDALASFDRSFKDFIPVMLERIGDLESDDDGIFGSATRMISKIFGIKTERKTSMDLSKIEKGPVPFNGMANHTIIEIIPKYLRESNTYLREIAQVITGKSDKDMSKNFTGFDWETGEFRDLEELRDNVYRQIEDRVTSTFSNSDFGQKMASQKSLLESEEDRKNYDGALKQLYSMIEKHEGQIDFANSEHMNEIMSGVNASDSIKNLIESYIQHLQETSDSAIGNAIVTKQRATRERNLAFKDVEENATERGIRQFIDRGTYDDYLSEKYKNGSAATISEGNSRTQNINMSVPSLLQGIQDTLNRGIYVQIKKRLGGKKGNKSSTSEESDATMSNDSQPTPTQSKEQFMEKFKSADDESSEDGAEIADEGEQRSSIRTRVGTSAANKVNVLTNVLNGIMAGNSDSAFDALMQGVRDKFLQVGEFLGEHFFTPIKKHLFGEKNEDGYIEGGIFGGVNNRMKESFYSLRRMITGKGYTDADGNVIQDANEEEMQNTVAGKLKGMLTSLKDGISVKLFGEKDEDGEVTKEGILPKAKKSLSNGVSSFMKGLAGWKHALFGKDSDDGEDDEETGRKTWESIKEKAKDVLPSALTGTLVGAAGGGMAGGMLGTLIGGPVGGALLGLAGGIASRSDRFKNWLFGPEDDEGNRTGGVISKKVQDFVKENKSFLVGGAAIGAAKGAIVSSITGSYGGMLGTLVGGPLAGAVLGVGTSILLKSDMFKKFMFGDEKSGYKGLVNTVKGMFGRFGKSAKDKSASGGKLAGMLGIGAGVGAITLGAISNSGLLGLSLGAMGPIGGAILGLGAGILAQKDNFKEWLFGKTDEETGEKRLGVIGKFSNMLKVNVFRPIGNNLKAIGRDFKSFLYYDVLQRFNTLIEPIGNAIFGTISNIAGRAMDTVTGFGRYIKENFLDKGIEKLRGLLAPVVAGANAAAKGIYKVGKMVVGAPFKLVEMITSPIALAVGKVVKNTTKAIYKTFDIVLVKPIKNLVLKPLIGVAKFTGNIIKKPFEIISSVAEKFTEKYEKLSNQLSIFFHNVAGEFKQWLLHDNPVAKGLRVVGQKVKDFGARIKDTAKVLVSPLTSFVKTAITEVKDHLLTATKKFFSALNPINWIKFLGKGIGKLFGRDSDKKKETDPTKMGRIRRAWFKAGQGMIRNDEGGYETLKKARKHNNFQRKHARKRDYYEAEDGTTYHATRDGKYFMVEDAKGKDKGIIKASELPEGLQKKSTGVDGKFEVKMQNRLDRYRLKNQKLIDKWTGHQKTEDTEENRKLAIEMAARKGKNIVDSFYDIETEDAHLKEQLHVEEETRDAAVNIEQNTKESNETQRSILETVKFMFTASKEEKAEYKRQQEEAKKNAEIKKSNEDDIIKKKADFLSGRERRTAEDDERAAEVAYEHGENAAKVKSSDYYKEAKRKVRKRVDKQFNEKREDRYSHNYTTDGFFNGLFSNLKEAKNEIKGGLNFLKKRKSSDDEDEQIERHEKGTNNANAGPAIVGEGGPEVMYKKGSKFGKFVGLKGPEVVNLEGGETIIPNNRLPRFEMGTDNIDDENDSFTHSMLDDDSLMDSTDSKKLSIAERVLRELLNIKNVLSLFISGKKSADGLFKMSGIDDISEDVANASIETDVSDNKEKSPILALEDKQGKNNQIEYDAFVDNTSNKTSSAKDKIKSINSKMKYGASAFIDVLSKNEKKEKAEKEKEKAELALSEVTGLTGESRHALVEAQKEDDSDDAREEAILSNLEEMNDGQKKHNSMWSSIFGKSGLITGALALAAPLLVSFIKGFWKKFDPSVIVENVIDPIKNAFGDIIAPIKDKLAYVGQTISETYDEWKDRVIDEYEWGQNWLGDGKTSEDKIYDNVMRGTSIYDENGNIDHQTGARLKLLAKGRAKIGASIAGQGDATAGSNKLIANGKNKLKNVWNKFRKKTDVSDIADDGVELVDDAADIASDVGVKSTDNVASSSTTIVLRDPNAPDMTMFQRAYEHGMNVNKMGSEIGEKTAKSLSDDGAQLVTTKIVKESGEAAAAKAITEDSLWTKVIKMIKEAFDGIISKVTKKTGSKSLAKAAAGSTDNVMKNVGKCKKFFPKVSGKIASVLGLTAGLGATVVGLAAKEGTWVAIGALNGLSGAQRLFRVDEVDSTMTIISGVIGGLLGTTVGSIIDIINELVASVLGIDIVSQLATLIYCAIMNISGNEEAADALTKAQDEFKERFEDDQEASLAKQYETMKRIGSIGQNVSKEEFIAGAKEGKYDASIQSFSDYNDEQHQTMMSKVGTGAKKGFSGLKKTLMGSKETSYKDEKGNTYTENDDGTFQVTSKDGKDLGFVAEDAIPEDAVQNVEKTEGVLVKLGKGLMKIIKPIVEVLGAALPPMIESVGYTLSGDPMGLIKQEVNISDDVPMAGLAKALTFIPRITGFFPSCVMWIGKKALDLVGPLIDGIFDSVTELGEEVGDSLNCLFTGDIAGLWTNNVQGDGILGPINYILAGGVRTVMTPFVAISWLGHNIVDIVKAIPEAVKNGFNNIKTMATQNVGYLLNGDIAGLWQSDLQDDEGNPVNGFYKVLHVGSKLAITIPTAISWVGHKVWDFIKAIPGAVKTGITNVTEINGQLSEYFLAGDITGLWNSEYEDDEGNPVGGFFSAVHTGGKLVWTIPTAISWVGHKIWDGIKSIPEKVGKATTNILDMNKTLGGFFLDGDITGLWKSDFKDEEGNPIGGIYSALYTGGKLVWTIPTAISWVGHKIWDGVTAIPKAISGNYDRFKQTMDTISDKADDSNFGGIWETELNCEGADPLTPIWHIMTVIGKVFQTLKAAIKWLPNKLGAAWDFVKDLFGWGGSGTGTNSQLPDGYADKIEAAKQAMLDSVGGSGNFNNTTSNITKNTTIINNTTSNISNTEAVSNKKRGTSSNIIGGRGEYEPSLVNGVPYYSQKDSRWADKKFVRSDGEDDGATMADTGCGPTAMAMVVSAATGKKVNPVEMAQYAQKSGYRDDTGVNANFIDNAAHDYGVDSVRADLPTEEFMNANLESGRPMVLLGRDNGSGDSPYTTAGHYVVAVGKDKHGNAIINDPRGTSYSSRTVPMNTLKNRTMSAWSFDDGTLPQINRVITPSRHKRNKIKLRGGRGGVTAQDVVAVARNEIGYLEKVPGAIDSQLDDKTAQANLGPSGSEKTKYYRDLGLGSGGYWCAAFVSWCIWYAANKDKTKANELLCGGVSASCNYIMNNFKSKGQFESSPRVGDLIMFDWADSGDPLADHVGIVVSVDDNNVYTIEGNSSNPNDGADGVFEHQYSLNDSQIMGYCRPAYDGSSDFTGVLSDSVDSENSSTGDTSFFGRFTSMMGKFGSTLFDAVLTGDYNIDWKSVFSEPKNTSGTANNGVVTGKVIKVPREVQTGITENYTNYDYWFPKWASSSNQRVIANEWDEKGRAQDRGIAMLDGNYLLAMTPKFGTTGDIVSVKLEDGETFNAILADSKGADADSEWGHTFGDSGKSDIIEWEACVGSDSSVGRGHDGISLEGNWLGKYIDTVTNGGPYSEWIKNNGGSSSTSGASSTNSNKANSASDAYREQIKNKYGHYPKYDSKTGKYYVYDKNGHKVSGTLEYLATGGKKTDYKDPITNVTDKLKSKGILLKWDDAGDYFYNYNTKAIIDDRYLKNHNISLSLRDAFFQQIKEYKKKHKGNEFDKILHSFESLIAPKTGNTPTVPTVPNSPGTTTHTTVSTPGGGGSIGGGFGSGVKLKSPHKLQNIRSKSTTRSEKPKGGFGESSTPVVQTKKYAQKPIKKVQEGKDAMKNVSITDRPLPTMKNQENVFNQTNNVKVDNGNLEKLLMEVINILGSISKNSSSLPILSDIYSSLSKPSSSNVINNTTNNITTNKVPQKKKQSSPTSGKMSRSEEIARKIAFG